SENEVLASPVKTASNSPSVNQTSSRERRRTRKVIAAKNFEENSTNRVVHNQPLFDTPTKVHKQNVLDSPSIENSQFKNPAREGSSHFSVEESSLDGSRSLTSQSDNRSYRDKLRDRFHAVKDNTNTLCEEAAYDFFLLLWSEDTPSFQQETHNEEERPTSYSPTPLAAEEDEHAKLIPAEILNLKDEWQLVHFLEAEQTDWSNMAAKEQHLLYYPNTQPVPLKDKLEENVEPRYLEEEGLYVGIQPLIPHSNKNKLERRLKSEGNKHWFGDDGELLTLPDPRRPVPYSLPLFLDNVEPVLHVEYKPAFDCAIDNKSILDIDCHFLLELEVCSLTFTHHPLFSQEHILAQKLVEDYHRYIDRVELDFETRLTERLTSLRQARNNLRAIVKLQEEPQQEQLDRLNRYREEIAEARRQRQVEGQNDRHLLSRVLSLWRDMKKLREMQGYTVTPVRILIHREQCKDVQLEQIAWDQKIQHEIEDLEEELRETHNQDLDRYTQELEQWNENNKSISEEKSTEPCPPKHLDLATVRSIAVQSLSKYLRPPGEPRIHLELGTMTLSNTQNNNEKLRQSAVSRCQVFVKVFFNNKEVCQSSKRPLGSNFSVSFQEIFPLCITEWPHTLKLELYEEGGTFNRHLLAEVYIPIPASTTTLQSCEATRHQFSNTQVVTVSHAGVGSGVYISPLPNNLQECLYTSGYIICRVGWGLDELNGTILAPPDKYAAQEKRWSCCADMMGMLDSDGPVNVEKLRAWADKSLLDPNDPTNAAFYNFIKGLDESNHRQVDVIDKPRSCGSLCTESNSCIGSS
ncbi:unnamed protein product, partial [Timema podura]|nr:unnamed protein product [Timema podura]